MYRQVLTEGGMKPRTTDCVIKGLQTNGLDFDTVSQLNPDKQPALAKRIEKITLACAG
jgi:hypothetical protein